MRLPAAQPDGLGALFPSFDRRFFDGDETFTTIGSGSIGGKALGLAFIRNRVLSRRDQSIAPGVAVDVPTLTVVATDMFDAFLKRNRLVEFAQSGAPDDRIARAFLGAELPVEIVGDLRGLIERVHTPLAVRSSSLLEDALAHPFAGVYGTKMIPNNQPGADTRFARLAEAIKLVYASTFFESARSYQQAVGSSPEAEKMAVIIQEIVGARHGDRFYPNISGVARSFNYYPSGRSRSEDGVVSLALGLGKTIVDGGVCWVYAPNRPAAPPPFASPSELLRNTQTSFWAVTMGAPPPYDPFHEAEYLVHASLADAEEDGTLGMVASTYDASSDRLCPGITLPGPRALTFAHILGARTLPLNECVRHLLMLSKEAVGLDVEIEFAVTLDPNRAAEARLGFLQARPMAAPSDNVEVAVEDLRDKDVLVASTSALGNGLVDSIYDVVFLKPEAFIASATQRMSVEIASINQALLQERHSYVLIGFGRWGSSDPWLGVPVVWGQISAARVIVEAALPGMSPEMSQGSHFFHNMIGFQVLYLSVPRESGLPVDWAWLEKQESLHETSFVRHVRTTVPLLVKVDGRSGRGMIAHGG
jgi:hypothetical protein